MEKTSHSAKGDASVKEVFRRLFIDLNQLPEEGTDDVNEPQKNDGPAPLHLSVNLCFRKEDMAVLKEKYEVLGSSSVAAVSDGFKDLGFHSGRQTLMCTRDKRVKFPGKSPYDLGRSWFKKGFTEKDKPQDLHCLNSLPKPLCTSMVEVRKEGDKDKEKNVDHLAAKGLLREFIRQAKARARNGRKKGKEVQVLVPFTFTLRRGMRKKRKRRFYPKMRRLNDIYNGKHQSV